MRVLIGGFFIFSGGEKLIGPFQNFLYVVQGYDLLPSLLEKAVAFVVPWMEFLIGVFLILGFQTITALRFLLILLCIFILVVGQAIVRSLPIDQCGCFGESLSIPLWGVLMFDSLLLLLITGLIFNIAKTRALSLDKYFASQTAG